jgi:hypothetical protein
MNAEQFHAAVAEAVQQQLAARGAAAAAPAPRLAPPPAFAGRPNTLDAWLSRMTQQFAWYRYATDAHEARIRLAATSYEGAALDWWINLAQQPQTWDALVLLLRSRFQPVTAATTARARLLTLTQGRGSVHEYVNAFRNLLVSVPDMAEADRLFHFKRGLREHIAMQLTVQGVDTLSAAIDTAVRIGSAHPGSYGSAAGSSSGHAPMELDAMFDNVEGLEPSTADAPITRAELQQYLLAAMRDHRRSPASSGAAGSRPPRGPPKVPHLSEAQVKEYMATGKCFGCGSTAHAARQCPKRKVGADGKVSWSN